MLWQNYDRFIQRKTPVREDFEEWVRYEGLITLQRVQDINDNNKYTNPFVCVLLWLLQNMLKQKCDMPHRFLRDVS